MSSSYSIRSGSRERDRKANTNKNGKSKKKPDETNDDDSTVSSSSSSSSSSTVAFSLTPAQYKSLVFSHSLALIPSFLLLILLLLLAIHSPCHLHALPLLNRKPRFNMNDPSSQDLNIPLPSPQDSNRLSSQRCFTILNSGLTYSTLILASISWLASYSVSRFSFNFSTLIVNIFHFIKGLLVSVISSISVSRKEPASIIDQEEEGENPPAGLEGAATSSVTTTVTSILSILIKTSVLECLRLGSLILSFALVRAQIPRLHGHDQDGPGSLPPPGQSHGDQPWLKDLDHSLQPTDIRFKLALWCALGWAATEVLFGSYQLFQQLSLYSPNTIFPNLDGDEEELFDESEFILRSQAKLQTSNAAKVKGGSDLKIKEQVLQEELEKKESKNNELRDNHFEALGIKTESGSNNQLLSSSSTQVPNYGSTLDVSSNQNSKVPPSPSRSNNTSSSSISLLSNPTANSDQRFVDEEQGEGSSVSSRSLTPILTNLDSRVQSLLLLHKRSELESQLGTSLSLVPVPLTVLWKIDAILWNLALTLLAAASIVYDLGPIWSGGSGRNRRHRQFDEMNLTSSTSTSTSTSTFVSRSRHHSSLHPHLHQPPIFPSFESQIPILIFLITVHTILTTLWTLSLPKLGFGILTYSSLLSGIGLLIAAGGWWQVVV